MSDRKRIYLCLAQMSDAGLEQKCIKEVQPSLIMYSPAGTRPLEFFKVSQKCSPSIDN